MAYPSWLASRSLRSQQTPGPRHDDITSTSLATTLVLPTTNNLSPSRLFLKSHARFSAASSIEKTDIDSSAASTIDLNCSSLTLNDGLSPSSTRSSFTPSPKPSHSTGKLVMIHFALGLALFLATTDVHLVATSLPTISSDLHGASALYTWVGVAYILPQTVLQPLWGKVADIVGRKPVLYCCIALFLVGSMLCGFSQSMLWLVIARGISGAGAGGLVPMVWIITGEVVPVEARAKWADMLTCVWTASALAGPLLGGVFSQAVSWRWGFWINGPISVLSVILLLVFLRDELPGPDSRHWKVIMGDLNYVGLALLVTGTTSLLMGFSVSSSLGWHHPATIVMLAAGGAGLVSACVQETYTSKTRFIPAGVFAKNGAILSIGSFFQTFSFTAAMYYLALFFQAVSGASAIQAGVMLLPFSLGSALISVVGNLYLKNGGRPKHLVVLGLGVASLGFGLMTMLGVDSCKYMIVTITLVAGLGMGLLFRSPFAAMERALPEAERAPMTACFFLVRFIGTSVGLAVAGALFDTAFHQRAPMTFVIDTSSIDWKSISLIPDAALRVDIMNATASALSLVWILCTPLLSLSCILSFFIDDESATAAAVPDAEAQVSTPFDEKTDVKVKIVEVVDNRSSISLKVPAQLASRTAQGQTAASIEIQTSSLSVS